MIRRKLVWPVIVEANRSLVSPPRLQSLAAIIGGELLDLLSSLTRRLCFTENAASTKGATACEMHMANEERAYACDIVWPFPVCDSARQRLHIAWRPLIYGPTQTSRVKPTLSEAMSSRSRRT